MAEHYYNIVMRQIVNLCRTSYESDETTYYRGESEQFPTVSSKLWRHYSEKQQSTWESKSEEGKCQILDQSENKIVDFALNFMGDTKTFSEIQLGLSIQDSLEILTEIQHLGGITNFIDFTKNLNIALFFACLDSFHKDGRIIVYHFLKQQSEYPIVSYPEIAYSRAQSSILVRPKSGVIETDKKCIDVINIPKEKKGEILNHLVHIYDVGITTVYSDLHGYLRNQKLLI